MEELKTLLLRNQRLLLKFVVFGLPSAMLLLLLVQVAGDWRLYKTSAVDPHTNSQHNTPDNSALTEDPLQRAIKPIFGNYRKESDVTKLSDLPTTTLSLVLHAIFYSNDPKAGMAIISKQGNRKTTLYSVGETIMTGVRLEQVLVDNVVINRNGQSESLRLPRLSNIEKG